jgi:uncharacterized protein (TIGR03663 family)
MRALRGLRPNAVTALVLGIVAVALAMRLVDLSVRAMHHDESLHALFSWYFAEGRGYAHDPLMHGPLQFHLIAGAFHLFGASELVARLPAALAGTALVASPLLLRRWLGGTGTVAVAALLALSPALLYFSRFARNDVPVALFTLLLVVAVWRYREGASFEGADSERAQSAGAGPEHGDAHGDWRWLLLAAGALALAFTAKESAYLSVAMLLLYLDGAVAWSLLPARLAGRRRALAWAALLPVAWALVALWPLMAPLRRRLALGGWSRDADLLVLVGTLTATQIAALAQLPVEALGVELTERRERVLSVVAIAGLFGGAATIGMLWNWRLWLAGAAVFAAIYIPLYSSLGSNPEGVYSGLWSSLDYWVAQQDVQRGGQPAFYYALMLPLYEPLALLAGLAGGAWLLWRGDRLARLLAWWFVITFVGLSLAGEKMPWLTVHLALPLALLAGLAVGRALPPLAAALARPGAPARAWAWAGIAAALLLALGGLTLRTGTAVSYGHPDTPVEPLIYTQTSPDVPALAREIEAYAAASGQGRALPLVVDTTASLSWPWAWYLRDFARVRYVSSEQLVAQGVEPGSVLIATSSTLAGSPELREPYERSVPYRHRWWFPEGRYKSATAALVLEGIVDGSLLADWWQFLATRVDESLLGSLDAEVLFPPAPAVRAAGAGGSR